jgi:hypothetical protein
MKLIRMIGICALVLLMLLITFISWTALQEVRALQSQLTATTGDVQVSTPPPFREEHLARLHDGGYVIFLRHAEREHGLTGVPFIDLSTHFDDFETIDSDLPGHCLTETGKQSAVKFGQFFEELKIDIGAVYSSPICRAMQTAELAFGRIDGVVDELSFLRHNYGDTETRVYYAEKLQSFIKSSFRDDTNVVLSAHGNMLYHMDIPDGNLEELGFFILDRELEIVAIANPDQFADLIYAMRLKPKDQ